MENDEDDGDREHLDDIGIPLTFANYTPKIDSPLVHVGKFPRDGMNLRETASRDWSR